MTISLQKKTTTLFTFTENVSYPISDKINIGFTSGMYVFIRQKHFLDIKRTFVAIPLQTSLDYCTKFDGKSLLGLRLSPGILFYKIDENIFKIKNAFLLNTELYYGISPQSKINIGFNLPKEKTKFEDYLDVQNKYVNHNFSINRTAILLGYSMLIN